MDPSEPKLVKIKSKETELESGGDASAWSAAGRGQGLSHPRHIPSPKMAWHSSERGHGTDCHLPPAPSVFLAPPGASLSPTGMHPKEPPTPHPKEPPTPHPTQLGFLGQGWGGFVGVWERLCVWGDVGGACLYPLPYASDAGLAP